MDSNKSFIIKMSAIIAVSLFVLGYYLAVPRPEKEKRPTFEESLEKRQGLASDNVTSRSSQTNHNYRSVNRTGTQSQITVPETEKAKTLTDYNKLLDSLLENPITDIQSVQSIINKLLAYKGYPQNTVKAVEKSIDQSRAKIHESYLVANFDFTSGNINISKDKLYELNKKVLIAILTHELDHFDKLAGVCKSMGINNFKSLLEENNISIDTKFWTNASQYADIKKYDVQTYEKALERFITQNEIERTSSYADFYRFAENMRNPLEESAYKESDYVYNHYKMLKEDGPMKRMTKKFNDVDWTIYNFIKNNNILSEERIAIFDYYFAQAINTKMPQFLNEYNKCVNNKNGDLTSYWLAYENSVMSFYKRGSAMDKQTYDKIYGLLEETDKKAKTHLNSRQIADALKFKINTLTSNLVYPNATKYLSITINDYLKFIKAEGITDDEQELKCIILLLCMENDLTTTNKNSKISLYDLKIPEEIQNMYKISGKKGRFLFIYNNPAFKNKKDPSMSESAYFEKLLNMNRLDIRLQK